MPASRFLFVGVSCSLETDLPALILICSRLLLDKYLLALRCLKAALALNKDHPKVLEQATRLRKALGGAMDSLAPKVKEVIESELVAVPGA